MHINFFNINLQEHDEEPTTTVQDWMLICQQCAEFPDCDGAHQNVDWSLAATMYANLDEMPHFVAQQRQHYVSQPTGMTADPERLQGKQLMAYRIVREHFEDKSAEKQPLRMIVSGTAGTGKSYLTQCLRLLLGDTLKVTAPTGAAAFIVDGYTLHSLLCLPVKGEFKELVANHLQTIQ